jgi:hypothetical protein
VRVQEHAAQAEALEARIELSIAVSVVASDGVSPVRRVHANLMRASRADRDIDEGSRIADAFDEPKLARRELAAVIDLDAGLAFAPRRDERLRDARRSLRPTTFEQCEVMLVDAPLTQQCV